MFALTINYSFVGRQRTHRQLRWVYAYSVSVRVSVRVFCICSVFNKNGLSILDYKNIFFFGKFWKNWPLILWKKGWMKVQNAISPTSNRWNSFEIHESCSTVEFYQNIPNPSEFDEIKPDRKPRILIGSRRINFSNPGVP